MTVVALGPDAGKAVLGALKRNEVVCLLSDRDLDGRGVEVEFFGERTTLPAGPATLGIRTGAPILPTAVYFTPRYNGHFGLVRPPLDTTRSGSLRDDVARVTQQLARELELLITRAPQQWHLFQPNWPSTPGTERTAADPAVVLGETSDECDASGEGVGGDRRGSALVTDCIRAFSARSHASYSSPTRRISSTIRSASPIAAGQLQSRASRCIAPRCSTAASKARKRSRLSCSTDVGIVWLMCLPKS